MHKSLGLDIQHIRWFRKYSSSYIMWS